MSKTIADQLRSLASQLDSQPAASEYVGPGLVVIGGAALTVDEPIRADWEPPLVTVEMTRYGRVGYEPSNAFDSGLPKRSPAGYPMAYAVGQYGPQGPGRVMFSDVTHDDDAAVELFKRTRAERGFV